MSFLPITKEEMRERGWEQADFILVTGDAYVDHPSFGTAIISRVLEARGYRVAILPQPDWRTIQLPRKREARTPIPRAGKWEEGRIGR